MRQVAAYLKYNGTDGLTYDLTSGPGRTLFYEYAVMSLASFPLCDEGCYLDVATIAEAIPCSAGADETKRTQKNAATWARLACVMADARMETYRATISQGFVVKENKRKELDVNGKHVNDEAWQALTDYYLDAKNK